MASSNGTTESLIECSGEEFLINAISKLNLGDLSDDDIVMEIDCENGKYCKIIADLFPNLKKIVGITKHKEPDVFLHKHDNIQYCEADIKNRSSLSEWDGKVTRIYSINYFNLVEVKMVDLRNFYHLLKPGGGAAIIFQLFYPYYVCLEQTMEIPRWQTYKHLLKVFDDIGRCNITCAQFRTILEKVGFEVVDHEMKEIIVRYNVDGVCKSQIGRYLNFLSYLPSNIVEEFKKDYLGIFERINGRSSDGLPRYKQQLMNLILKKN